MTVVLDAHLLLLLTVGAASRDYIAKHRRLKDYTDADFTLLTRMLSSASKIIVTPNTLTETSNLAGYISEPARTHVYRFLRVLVEADTTEERYVERKLAVARGEFARIGLTDSALLHIATTPHVLLTADLELYLAALGQGMHAVNFNHHRFM